MTTKTSEEIVTEIRNLKKELRLQSDIYWETMPRDEQVEYAISTLNTLLSRIGEERQVR